LSPLGNKYIRGPASAIWGANAMNGVINIITRPPREVLGTTFAFGIGTFDRSGGVAKSNRGSLYYVNATHAQALNNRWAFKITGGAYTQDAFARPTGPIPTIISLYHSSFTNEGTTQPKAEARVDYDFPDGKQDVILYGGYTDAYTVINLSAGVRLDRSGKYMAMLKVSNLGNSTVQNHIYGDILKRQITGEFRVRFGK
jgi:outer membrane receptor protein involved in Fe transport